ncbi:hypothetical protein DFH07DRAFT_898046 [Mycena maculata]|uniref:Phosphatidate phosphatase APP1 catalytic domain-containing protein n=1 Tax=Mycena maculata TaxID=230809 RepID=A0AAD7HK38_9AGAR|nr:hypothetical protein DFH07DRAFT_898046 [Mycena maculata]
MSELQRQTRRERRFSDVEASLPTFSPHTSVTLDPTAPVASAKSTLADLLSYLGPYNPRPLPLTENDAVWLFDNTAFRTEDGAWQAEFVAAVFTREPSTRLMDAVVQVADKLGLGANDPRLATIEERLRPFLMDILPGRLVTADFAGVKELSLGPGGRNGISSDVHELHDLQTGSVVSAKAKAPEGATGLLDMKTHFVEDSGWGVISDIDDTIKVTMTSDPLGILTSTFLSEPIPVPGIPDLYKYIQSLITPASPFFYLSASPYNLYPFLRGFRDQHYPQGQIILRDASWMSIPGLLSSLTLGTHEYKVDRMHKINSWLPGKKMICIGDSTQSDPESYGEIYRTFPGWVHVILIRKARDIAELGIEAKNEPARFETAFEGVPRSVWHVFEDPKECYDIIKEAVFKGLIVEGRN